MRMEVLAVQNQYQSQYGALGSSKVKDWTKTLTAPSTPSNSSSMPSAVTMSSAAKNHPYLQSHSSSGGGGGGGSLGSLGSLSSGGGGSKIKHSINKSKSSSSCNSNSNSNSNMKQPRYSAAPVTFTVAAPAAAPLGDNERYNSNLFFCDDHALDTAAVQQLSARLLDELRAAKRRHLTCTEVSLPCDLAPRVAAEIIRVSAREPCGLRGSTIYIEFEDEPNNSRRIASLKIDADTVSTFEVYLTLRQDHRGWTALLPQFMKSLARTITISPEFTITKNKLYAAQQQHHHHQQQLLARSSSINYSSSRSSQRVTLATPTS